MDSEIQQYAGDILAHPRFQQLRTFCHHGLDNSVYDHSVAVAEAACQIARLMRLSESETTSVVRAALLHDFFGYDWHGERFRRYAEGMFDRVEHQRGRHGGRGAPADDRRRSRTPHTPTPTRSTHT